MSSSVVNLALTLKQNAFVDAYLGNGGNATRAAISAGYSRKSAGAQGTQLKRSPVIAAELKRRMGADKLVATRDERQRFWSSIMRGRAIEESEKPKGKTGRPSIVERKPTLSERLEASTLLGKAQGDFVSRTELTGAGGGPVEITEEAKARARVRLSALIKRSLVAKVVPLTVDSNLEVRKELTTEAAGQTVEPEREAPAKQLDSEGAMP